MYLSRQAHTQYGQLLIYHFSFQVIRNHMLTVSCTTRYLVTVGD